MFIFRDFFPTPIFCTENRLSAAGSKKSHRAVDSKVMSVDELATAAALGKIELVTLLLQKAVDVNGINRFQRTPVQVMMMGSKTVARLLLEHGADPNVRDCSTGTTPLHDAAREGFLETARVLVEYQANPQMTDNRGYRPVDLAHQEGHQDVVDFLRSVE